MKAGVMAPAFLRLNNAADSVASGSAPVASVTGRLALTSVMRGELSTTAGQRLLHHLVRRFQQMRRALWFVTRPAVSGVHAIALTGAGKIVLVQLSYADGWRLPGGGRKADESPEEAMLRELREEIGLTAHETLERVSEFNYRPDFRRAEGSLFVARGVVYEPKWSLEIKAVAEFDPDALPVDTAAITNWLIETARNTL